MSATFLINSLFENQNQSENISTELLTLYVKFERLNCFPPGCGYLATGGLYRAKVLDSTIIKDDYILIFVLCKEAQDFKGEKIEVTLHENINPTKGYQIKDCSMTSEKDKKSMKKFLLYSCKSIE